MKLAITILTVALSSQALADCAVEDKQQSAKRADSVQVSDQVPAMSYAQRRQMVLDCMMRPAPFTPEPLSIELDNIEDEFIEEAETYPEVSKTVAANS